MKLRRNPFPQKTSSLFLFLTLTVIVPLGWIYDICIVLPAIHEPGGLPHTFTCLLAIFLLLNIEGNFLASMMTDTSVDFESAVPPPDGTEERLEWKHCDICDKLAPPKSRHCKYCGVCILKRHHHCGFTGYCVGHQNQRYFLCFVLYTVIGSVHSLIYNAIYMWGLNGSVYSKIYFNFWQSIIMTWFDFTFWEILQVVVFGLNFLLVTISIAILCMNASTLWCSDVCCHKEVEFKYHNGVVNNLKSVFGLRMHVAWLFPFINSPLPEDGYNWEKVAHGDSRKKIED
ncbi:probable palmitoyltransferase ZDHHC24 isoform X1 [Drosophila albomicans]|uniref:Palmitoyltransferase n=1 Tax=Drosophila albomicans TaxID=7291 RepID=A0A6P8YMC7_DROAB|nr:probable palmitoyltransferase ZDHHC24 isoform X1 [Drosophila albomicans]